MRPVNVSAATAIDAPAHLVRRQFGDVAHHAAAGVHRRVRFHVVEDHGHQCRYLQVTSVGPLRLRQELVLERADEGPLVNTITKGQFRGGTITFDITEDGSDRAVVRAELDAVVRGPQVLVAPILRTKLRRALTAALAEDKADLESGAYAQRG